jgi:hypothetical protein
VHIDASLRQREAGLKTTIIKTRVDILCARLHVAGIHLYLGKPVQAQSALDEVREFLYQNNPFKAPAWHPEYARLLRTYIGTLSHAPVSFALERVEELFGKIAKVANTYTTATHYSRLHLNVVEEFVLGFMQPDFILGETARRWLDDDEYLVRRRIHGDMKKLLKQSGL